jgi:hypothetical protein
MARWRQVIELVMTDEEIRKLAAISHSRKKMIPLFVDHANFEITIEGCSCDRLPWDHENKLGHRCLGAAWFMKE